MVHVAIAHWSAASGTCSVSCPGLRHPHKWNLSSSDFYISVGDKLVKPTFDLQVQSNLGSQMSLKTMNAKEVLSNVYKMS